MGQTGRNEGPDRLKKKKKHAVSPLGAPRALLSGSTVTRKDDRAGSWTTTPVGGKSVSPRKTTKISGRGLW